MEGGRVNIRDLNSSIIRLSKCHFLCNSFRRVQIFRFLPTLQVITETPSALRHLFNRADGLVLRPYQQECIEKCLQRFEKGVQRQVVSLPVGSGKTVIFAHLIKALPVPENMPQATKTLVLAHREELLHQAYLKISQAKPDAVICLYSGRQKDLPSDAEVIIASVPKLGRALNLQHLDSRKASEFKLIVIDEAHHAPAPSYQKILQKFSALDVNSHIKVWGCSASLYRSDGVGFWSIFQEISYYKSLTEMMEQKWLSDLVCFHVKSRANLKKIRKVHGDFNPSQLASAVNNNERNMLIFKSWHEMAYLKGRKSTLIFAVGVDHAIELTRTFQEQGISAQYVHAKTPLEERYSILEDFRGGRLLVLVNCGIFTEGTDIPCIDCIIMARPTCSKGLFIQMIGRGLRLHPQKENCLIIFIHDDYLKHNLATVPTLLGLDPKFSMKGESMLRLKSMVDQCTGRNSSSNLGQFLSLESMHQWLEEGEDITRRKRMASKRKIEMSKKCGVFESLSMSRLADPTFSAEKIDLVLGHKSADPEMSGKDGSKSKTLDSYRSPFVWNFFGQGHAILDAGSFGRLVILRAPENLYKVARFMPRVTTKECNMSNKPTNKRSEFLNPPEPVPIVHNDFGGALRAADTFLKISLGFYPAHLLRSASWRKQPITPGQFKWLCTYFKKPESFQTYNRGQAASLIQKTELRSWFKTLDTSNILKTCVGNQNEIDISLEPAVVSNEGAL
jgi:superfamily II DNA or RNA helicase